MIAANRPTMPQTNSLRREAAPARQVARWTAAKLTAGLQHLCGNRNSDGFGILMYHRVTERVPGVEPPTNNVTPTQLRRQLAGLLAHGFKPWPLSQLVLAQQAGDTIPSTAFAVTFDDGYENNYLHALPILAELQIPATIFLATKYLDSHEPMPFDDWSAAGAAGIPASAWRPYRRCNAERCAAAG